MMFRQSQTKAIAFSIETGPMILPPQPAALSHEKAAAGGWDSDGFFPM